MLHCFVGFYSPGSEPVSYFCLAPCICIKLHTVIDINPLNMNDFTAWIISLEICKNVKKHQLLSVPMSQPSTKFPENLFSSSCVILQRIQTKEKRPVEAPTNLNYLPGKNLDTSPSSDKVQSRGTICIYAPRGHQVYGGYMNISLTRAIQNPLSAALIKQHPAFWPFWSRVWKKATGSWSRMSHLSITHESCQTNRHWCFRREGRVRQSARGVRKAVDYTYRQ